MAKTSVKSGQIKDGEVKRSDLNTTQSGEALLRRLVAGTSISLSSTGVDTGTGDVTVSVLFSTITATGNITSTGTNIITVLNSTTATSFGGYTIQRSGTYKAILGNSFSANALINGSVLDDLCIRNPQKILFSADAGNTIHHSIDATNFYINTANIKVGTNTGQSGTFNMWNNEDGYTEVLVFTKGILTDSYPL